MPTYDDVMHALEKKGKVIPGLGGPQGPPMPIVTAMIKCPHCDNLFPVRLRIHQFNLAVDVPMSPKDLAKAGRRAR